MPSRKPTDYVQFKLRIRQSLLKQLQREAAKKKHSANNEAVERLERSFANEAKELRDSEILDLMLAKDDLRGSIVRTMASRLARNPNWSGVKQAKEWLEMLDEDEKEKAEQEGDE
jgi:predicted nuclease with TOPRIM domain